MILSTAAAGRSHGAPSPGLGFVGACGMTDVDVDRLRERGDQPLPLFDPDALAVEPVDLDEEVAVSTPDSAPIHVVQFSTGAGSAEVAWRVVDKYGADNVHLLTANTLVEDEDNWRFAREVVAQLGCDWTVLTDGRTPMQVGRDHRVVPNNRMAVCSRVLKRELLRKHIDATYDPATTVIHLGFDWTEPHRFENAKPHWEPYRLECVLTEAPYLMKDQMLGLFRERGIEPPRLYGYGFAHANCSGCCVRGGQAQWALALQVNRDRYLEWEDEEQATRDLLGADVSILRDRRGGTTVPLTLRSFRERLDTQPALFDDDDWGACGCYMDGAA